MKKDPNFYVLKAKEALETFAYEEILLDLATKHLKRRIILIPFFEAEDEGCEMGGQEFCEIEEYEDD